jgi:UDP-N-acetylglucosamine--N-acetylmuramyl-(pentapeptide) pyrophosphoryl-undecaprenol N-acetylglucosamine transferase
LDELAHSSPVPWKVIAFEPDMEFFYAAADLVVARAGGAVAELAITATPSVLVPGGFGSGEHQHANARAFEEIGGAVVLDQSDLETDPGLLVETVRALMVDQQRMATMAAALGAIAKPDAADVIAAELEELHG